MAHFVRTHMSQIFSPKLCVNEAEDPPDIIPSVRSVNFFGIEFHRVVFFHLLCDLEIHTKTKRPTGINHDVGDRVRVDIKLDGSPFSWKKQQTRFITCPLDEATTAG